MTHTILSLSGEEIEKKSFEMIDREAGEHGFDALTWPVARRMVHASADFSILPFLKFRQDPVQRGIGALRRGASIVTDSTMLKSGLSVARLKRIHPAYGENNIFCNIADSAVSKQAADAHLPRSVFNMRSLKGKIAGGIVCIGNAPTALLEVCRLAREEGIRPALLIAMPVGFVNVEASKETALELSLPMIVMTGRRGGTPFVVAALNAIAVLALEQRDA
jgi:cobalt/nickel transport system ATP-binding protein/precorrin-8X/cobalt-precorrin-8 methylmutase